MPSWPVRAVRVREVLDVERGRADLAVACRAGSSVSTVSPCIGRVGGDVDERLDVRVAGRGVGDHDAAVGVADEHDRAADLAQDALDVGRVGGDAAQRVGRADDLVALVLEALLDAVPAGGVGEGAVDEDDGRLGGLGGGGQRRQGGEGGREDRDSGGGVLIAVTLWSAAGRPRLRHSTVLSAVSARFVDGDAEAGPARRAPAAVRAARLVARDVLERPVVHEARHQQLRRASCWRPGARPRRT